MLIARWIDSQVAMWVYLLVFISALVLDVIPFVAPPAWMAMVFLLVKFDLNPWLVLVLGVCGSTAGRYLFSVYVGKFSGRFMKRSKKEDLQFLGKKLTQKLWPAWLFVLLYTLTPISTTPLFTAAGIGNVKPMKIIPPFICGKFVSDAVIIFTGSYAAANLTEMLHGTFSWKGIVLTLVGVFVVVALFLVRWQSLLQKHKLQFTFKIWK